MLQEYLIKQGLAVSTARARRRPARCSAPAPSTWSCSTCACRARTASAWRASYAGAVAGDRHADGVGRRRRPGGRSRARRRRLHAKAVRSARASRPHPQRAAAGEARAGAAGAGEPAQPALRPARARPGRPPPLRPRRLRGGDHRHGVRPPGGLRPQSEPRAVPRPPARACAQGRQRSLRPQHRHRASRGCGRRSKPHPEQAADDQDCAWRRLHVRPAARSRPAS